MLEYQIPLNEFRREIHVMNSRFIATIAPVFSVEEAKLFIQRVKQELTDASHNVPAFIVGHGATEIAHCSDAGEPSGTAGKPMLAVLRGSGMGDVAVVVTRYFGGTKLGTGGLVRAYGDAVREVTTSVMRGYKVPALIAMLVTPYPLFEKIRRLISQFDGLILEQDFAAEITLTFRLRSTKFSEFSSNLSETTNGSISPVQIKEEYILVPIDSF
jgi:uncharacterized YigZ family protein